MLLLSGHYEKVNKLLPHPCASGILTTASFDLSVKIWDVANEAEKIVLEGHTEQVSADSEFRLSSTHIHSVAKWLWKSLRQSISCCGREHCLVTWMSSVYIYTFRNFCSVLICCLYHAIVSCGDVFFMPGPNPCLRSSRWLGVETASCWLRFARTARFASMIHGHPPAQSRYAIAFELGACMATLGWDWCWLIWF